MCVLSDGVCAVLRRTSMCVVLCVCVCVTEPVCVTVQYHSSNVQCVCCCVHPHASYECQDSFDSIDWRRLHTIERHVQIARVCVVVRS